MNPASIAKRLSGPWRDRLVIHGLTCLALLLAFFAHRTNSPSPAVRLSQTRLDYLTHLTCIALFLYSLFRQAADGRKFFLRPSLVLAIGWFGYACLRAIASPLRGEALETLFFWLDALLVFWVAMTQLSRDPEFFLALLAGASGLTALAAFITGAVGGDIEAPAELMLAAAATLLAGIAALSAGSGQWSALGGFFRLKIIALAILGLLVADALLNRHPAYSAASTAAWQIVVQRPESGIGLGVIPEILTGFAPGDYDERPLPMPPDSYLGLRAELGWQGLALLAALTLAAAVAAFRVARLFPVTPRTLYGFGLAGILIFALVDARWRPTLLLPYGQILVFLSMGMLMGLEVRERKPAPAMASSVAEFLQRVLRPGIVIFLLAAGGAIWAAGKESRPWRAARRVARIDLKQIAEARSGRELARAASIYPHDWRVWDWLAAHRRARLSQQSFDEKMMLSIIKSYEDGIAADPFQAKLYWGLADVYRTAKRQDKAVASLEQGLDNLPRNETLRRLLIDAMLDSRDFDGAVEQYKVLERDIAPNIEAAESPGVFIVNPEWIKVNFAMAHALEATEDLARAQEQYATAFQKDPSGPLAKSAAENLDRLKRTLAAK